MRSRKGRYIITGALLLLMLTASVYAISQNHVSYIEKFETDKVNIDLKTVSIQKNGESAVSTGIVEANKDISYVPRVTNRDAACYVRAKVDIATDDNDSEPLEADCLYGLNEKWIYKGDYLYYTEVMGEGDATDIFKGIHIPANWEAGNAEKLKVTVKTEAVQAKNFSPDFSAVLPWGAVKLETVAKAENMNVREAVIVQDMSELKYSSEGGFECRTSDLFDEIAGMMPGDIFEKSVVLENDSSNSLQMYLGLTSGQKKLGESLRLKITWEGTTLYDGSLAEAAGAGKIKMKKLPRGEKHEIKLVLSLPAGAENEYSSLNDCLIWQLNAEEMPETSAQTGDWNNMLPLAAVAVVSGLLMICALRTRKRGCE